MRDTIYLTPPGSQDALKGIKHGVFFYKTFHEVCCHFSSMS